MITNYLYMLLEQLRYTMANLGVENFNDAEFDHISELITDPVYVRLEDAEGNIASLTLTAENLTVRMEDAEGNLSVLQQTASSLTVRISDAEGNISVLQQTATSLTSRISDAEGNLSILQQTATSLTSRISDAEGNISSLIQTVDSITLSVSNGSTSSSISLSIDGVVVASQNIYMSGLVTYTGLAGGTTTIDGACIKTGTIDANRLNLSGAITFSDLSSDVRNDINTVSRWTYSGTTYIDGAQIMTGTVSASTLEGGEINLLNGSGQTAGIIELTGASSYGGQKVVLRSGAIELNSQAGDVYIRSGSYGNYLQLSNGVFVGVGDLAPHSSGAQSCQLYRLRQALGRSSGRPRAFAVIRARPRQRYSDFSGIRLCRRGCRSLYGYTVHPLFLLVPLQYTTTAEFLQYFGVAIAPEQLPDCAAVKKRLFCLQTRAQAV